MSFIGFTGNTGGKLERENIKHRNLHQSRYKNGGYQCKSKNQSKG